MSENELEIFNLCQRLAELLGDKEAIADLKKLYDKHPEMFKDMQEVSHTIKEVVNEPDLITGAKRKGAILAVRKLNDKKMGEIAVENDNGTSVIFHTNKKRIKEFKKVKSLQVETPTPSTHHSKLAGELMSENSSGANAHSANTRDIIPQNLTQSQESLGKNPSDSKQEKMNALREQVNNIAKNKTNSPKDLSPKIDKER